MSAQMPSHVTENNADGDSQHVDSDTTTKVESREQSTDSEHRHFFSTARGVAGTVKRRLRLDTISASGPSRVFNPTNVRIHFRRTSDESQTDEPMDRDDVDELAVRWQSRDNRKGRNPTAEPLSKKKSPVSVGGIKVWISEVSKGIWRMMSFFPYWDMSWYCGWSYAIGSILFVIDGAWAWLPLAYPDTSFPGEAKYGVGLLFFFGALLYELGATMAYLEAINDGSFQGSAMNRFLKGHEMDSKLMLDEKLHTFFGHLIPHGHKDEEKAEQEIDPESGWLTREQSRRPGSIYPSGKKPAPRRGGVDLGTVEQGEVYEYPKFRWYPTWNAFRHHHIFEIGFIACSIQLLGATLYAITGIVSLPGILNSLASWQELAAYWVPQIVASVCFLTAGILFTIETQENWYNPKLKLIGWWIGAWATVGSVGFLLSGIFGVPSETHSWCEYQSGLSSMWGSAAYLTSSFLQWYESVNKGPVLSFPNTNVVRDQAVEPEEEKEKEEA